MSFAWHDCQDKFKDLIDWLKIYYAYLCRFEGEYEGVFENVFSRVVQDDDELFRNPFLLSIHCLFESIFVSVNVLSRMRRREVSSCPPLTVQIHFSLINHVNSLQKSLSLFIVVINSSIVVMFFLLSPLHLNLILHLFCLRFTFYVLCLRHQARGLIKLGITCLVVSSLPACQLAYF